MARVWNYYTKQTLNLVSANKNCENHRRFISTIEISCWHVKEKRSRETRDPNVYLVTIKM